MVIKNKMESINVINKLGLNKFPEQLFKKNVKDKIKEFTKEYPAKYYAIRDREKPGGTFKLKVEKDNIFDEIKNYNLFSINVSSANYVKNQLLVGEIEILSNNEVYLTASSNPEYSVRDALKNPTYNLKTNVFSKKLNNIKHFEEIYSYIIKNELKDIIVEFALFDINVGINKENIIIYELRTNY